MMDDNNLINIFIGDVRLPQISYFFFEKHTKRLLVSKESLPASHVILGVY
jgi:hypothetical protein